MRARAAGALLLGLLLARGVPSGAQTQPPDSSGRLPAGLELLHLVPGDQPPLETLDPDDLPELRDQFNADSGFARVVLMMSPT